MRGDMAQTASSGAPAAPPGQRASRGRVIPFPAGRPPRWRRVVLAIALLLVIALLVLYATGQAAVLERRVLGQSSAVTYQTAAVSTGTVAQTVAATGPVAAVQTLPLSFKSSGK